LTVVGVVGVHGVAVQLDVVGNLASELDLAPTRVLDMGANHVME